MTGEQWEEFKEQADAAYMSAGDRLEASTMPSGQGEL